MISEIPPRSAPTVPGAAPDGPAARHPVPAALLAGATMFATFAGIEWADGFRGVRSSSGATEPGREGDGDVIVVLLLVGLALGLLGVGLVVGAVVQALTRRRLPPLAAELAAVAGVAGVVSVLVVVAGGSYGHWSPGYVVPRAALAAGAGAVAWVLGRAVLVRPVR